MEQPGAIRLITGVDAFRVIMRCTVHPSQRVAAARSRLGTAMRSAFLSRWWHTERSSRSTWQVPRETPTSMHGAHGPPATRPHAAFSATSSSLEAAAAFHVKLRTAPTGRRPVPLDNSHRVQATDGLQAPHRSHQHQVSRETATDGPSRRSDHQSGRRRVSRSHQ